MGNKTQYGAHVGPEWDKCPDSPIWVPYIHVCWGFVACLDLSVSSSSWGLGRAAFCDCGTPWTFLLPFLIITLGQEAKGCKLGMSFRSFVNYVECIY